MGLMTRTITTQGSGEDAATLGCETLPRWGKATSRSITWRRMPRNSRSFFRFAAVNDRSYGSLMTAGLSFSSVCQNTTLTLW